MDNTSRKIVFLFVLLLALSQIASSCERVTPTLAPKARTLTARATQTPVIFVTQIVVTATQTITLTPSLTPTFAPTGTSFVLRDAPSPMREAGGTVMP